MNSSRARSSTGRHWRRLPSSVCATCTSAKAHPGGHTDSRSRGSSLSTSQRTPASLCSSNCLFSFPTFLASISSALTRAQPKEVIVRYPTRRWVSASLINTSSSCHRWLMILQASTKSDVSHLSCNCCMIALNRWLLSAFAEIPTVARSTSDDTCCSKCFRWCSIRSMRPWNCRALFSLLWHCSIRVLHTTTSYLEALSRRISSIFSSVSSCFVCRWWNFCTCSTQNRTFGSLSCWKASRSASRARSSSSSRIDVISESAALPLSSSLSSMKFAARRSLNRRMSSAMTLWAWSVLDTRCSWDRSTLAKCLLTCSVSANLVISCSTHSRRSVTHVLLSSVGVKLENFVSTSPILSCSSSICSVRAKHSIDPPTSFTCSTVAY
mmetsp:Transcript_68099/g.181195  ORF Transcript_68099/g.181195 Transcript_68099/m.181195 type:complete len:381 (+) Transcript_68099:287-1429(+)